jgi:hypothetical protein
VLPSSDLTEGGRLLGSLARDFSLEPSSLNFFFILSLLLCINVGVGPYTESSYYYIAAPVSYFKFVANQIKELHNIPNKA